MNPSNLTKTLIGVLDHIDAESSNDVSSKMQVSQTVTFLGSLYEKMRNAVEYRESHLVRKAAIERILRRRLLLNQKAEDFSESLVRELLWGKYLQEDAATKHKITQVTNITSNYLSLRHKAISQLGNTKQINEVSNWIIELLACKIEFMLAPNPINEAYTNYLYQWLKPSIKAIGESDESNNILIYLSLHAALNKTDEPLLRYHLINIYDEKHLFDNFWDTYEKINGYINNPIRNKITKHIKKQSAPFLILEAIVLNSPPSKLEKLFENKDEFIREIQNVCQTRYKLVNARLKRAALRSIVYLFLTKMIIALVLEIPADKFISGHIEYIPLAINVGLPPALLFFITLLIRSPGKDNTKRITDRILEIVTQSHLDGETQTFVIKNRVSKPIMAFTFTIIYTLTFLLVFGSVIWLLSLLKFNIASQAIFLFFLSVVSFFAYRIRQIPAEYRYNENDGIFAPISDFFFLPILAVGKRLSEGVERINIITFVFDFILEAPFKAIFEVIEQWFSFLKSKREDIV